MTSVGYATLQIIPSTEGFGALLTQGMKAPVSAAGGAAGKAGGAAMGAGMLGALKGFAGPMAAVMGTMGVVNLIGDSINLEAQFSQTMATMAAVAQVPADQMKELSALALKLGADTSFSASEAADAMLELAKAGISPANIEAGALAGTLTLAAAGGTDLATAATIASNAMNTFGLAGSDMAMIAAALAGGANASTASIESLGEALSQVGPGAKNAGLSLQETVGVLAAFDSMGIKGSDAGTSLKTMLVRLVPATDAARNAMADLGLQFTNADGSFKDITDVAQQLHDKLGPLSDAQRSAALTTIFGSDAMRAATVLMNQGADGIQGFINATMDMNAAQAAADARMSGTAGAMERMRGSIETAKLAFGQLIAPAVSAGADALATAFGFIADGMAKLGTLDLSGLSQPLGLLGERLDGITGAFDYLFGTGGKTQDIQMFGTAMDTAFGGMGKFSDTFTEVATAGKSMFDSEVAGIQNLWGIVQTQLFPFIDRLVNDLKPVLDHIGETAGPIFTKAAGAVQAAWAAIGPVLSVLISTLSWLWDLLGPTVVSILSHAWDAVVGILSGAFDIIKGLFEIIQGLFTGDWSKLWQGVQDIFGGAWEIIKSVLGAALGVIWDLVVRIFGGIGSWIAGVWDDITGAIGRAKDWIGEKVGEIVDFFLGIPGKLGDLGRTIGEKLTNGVRDIWNKTIGGLGFDMPDWVPGMGGKSFHIPRLAKGGIATRPTFAQIGEAGPEAVVPLSKLDAIMARALARNGAGGGPTKVLNYYAAPGNSLSSEDDLFAAASRSRMGW